MKNDENLIRFCLPSTASQKAYFCGVLAFSHIRIFFQQTNLGKTNVIFSKSKINFSFSKFGRRNAEENSRLFRFRRLTLCRMIKKASLH